MRDGAPTFRETATHADCVHERLAQTMTLRVLATTDIHMQLVGHDYVTDTHEGHHGFAGLASLITQARTQAKNKGYASLLFDNGDLLQGGPLADLLAQQRVEQTHPAAAILNALAYDAVGLGNHDLDYGFEYLTAFARQLDMPMVATNLELNGETPFHHSALITAQPPAQTSNSNLQVGVVSVLPEQTAIWNAHVLRGQARIVPALASLRDRIAGLRKAGAEIVILLAHMGIRSDPRDNALTLAKHAGADALIAGHTHHHFPGNDHAHIPGVDADKGVLGLCPAVMPGHSASDLAVLDLKLQRNSIGNWELVSHTSTLVQNTKEVLPMPAIQKLCQTTHETVRDRLLTQIGWTDAPLHTYFSLIIPTPAASLLAQAKTQALHHVLHHTADAELPLLAAISAHAAGGLPGASNYVDIPKGPVLRRHVAGLAPYSDEICALRVTGEMVRYWLERAARVFLTLEPLNDTQRFTQPTVPPFNFDTLYGLTYTIDPTQPVGQRIGTLNYNGVPIRSDQQFMLATTQFRAAGGGGFLEHPYLGDIRRSEVTMESALLKTLGEGAQISFAPSLCWHFSVPTPIKAVLETAPKAEEFLDEIAHLKPKLLGTSPDGFTRIQITLS